MALASVWYGEAMVPAPTSLPPGETNTACEMSPSMPSQFESVKVSSGTSAPPATVQAYSHPLAVEPSRLTKPELHEPIVHALVTQLAAALANEQMWPHTLQ